MGIEINNTSIFTERLKFDRKEVTIYLDKETVIFLLCKKWSQEEIDEYKKENNLNGKIDMMEVKLNILMKYKKMFSKIERSFYYNKIFDEYSSTICEDDKRDKSFRK